MSGPQFHETGYGRAFFGHQLPTLLDTLGAIASELKRMNDFNAEQAVATAAYEPPYNCEFINIDKLQDLEDFPGAKVKDIPNRPVILGGGAPIIERNGHWLGQTVTILNYAGRTGSEVSTGVITRMDIDTVDVVICAYEKEAKPGIVRGISYEDIQ